MRVSTAMAGRAVAGMTPGEGAPAIRPAIQPGTGDSELSPVGAVRLMPGRGAASRAGPLPDGTLPGGTLPGGTLTLVLLLAACGGGGGGPTTSTPPASDKDDPANTPPASDKDDPANTPPASDTDDPDGVAPASETDDTTSTAQASDTDDPASAAKAPDPEDATSTAPAPDPEDVTSAPAGTSEMPETPARSETLGATPPRLKSDNDAPDANTDEDQAVGDQESDLDAPEPAGTLLPRSGAPSPQAPGGGTDSGQDPEIDAPVASSGGAGRDAPVSGSLYDGPIEGAAVYVDVNRNRQVDDGVDRLIDAATDSGGKFEGRIPERYRDHPLIADNRKAIHRDSAVDLPPFFVASAGSGVISPITHIVELDVVSEGTIRGHVLFGRSLAVDAGQLSRRFSPLEDNPYDGGEYVFGDHIRNFLEELTKAIAQTGDDHAALEAAVRDLLVKYQRLLSDAARRQLDGDDTPVATADERGDAKPEDAPPDAPNPDAPKPDDAPPDAPKPDDATPDAPNPDDAKPEDAKPDVPEPDARCPEA